jgi:hypothetical protein
MESPEPSWRSADVSQPKVSPVADAGDLFGTEDLTMGTIAALGQSPELEPLPGWLTDVSASMPIEPLVQLVIRRDVEIAFKSRRSDREFLDHLEESVRENLLALQNVLSGRIPIDQVRLSQPLAFASFQARAHLPQTSLQRSYRVGFFTFWQEWARAARDRAAQDDVPREEALLALSRLTQLILSYQDHVGSLVADAYAEAESTLRQSNAHLRQRLIRDILDGSVSTPSTSDMVSLGYGLNAWHVALIFRELPEAAAEKSLQSIRAALSIRETVVLPTSTSSSAAWIRRSKNWDQVSLRKLRTLVEELRTDVSIGESAEGAEGFRETFRQAEQVDEVRNALPDGRGQVLTYADVALEVLLLRDEALASAFVRRELGTLAGASPDNARLRETLEASFATDSHTAAAARLAVHEHTVRNRLRRAEELLGQPLGHRRTEMQVALRLHRLLGRRTVDFWVDN